MGALAEITVSDNLKSGITRACFHEPEVNRTYAELADHYGTAVLPARPYKPRDKAKVEAGVLLATRWIIAKLRNRTFFSLSELNDAIRGCLTTLNNRGSRYLGAALLARTTLDAPVRSCLRQSNGQRSNRCRTSRSRSRPGPNAALVSTITSR